MQTFPDSHSPQLRARSRWRFIAACALTGVLALSAFAAPPPATLPSRDRSPTNAPGARIGRPNAVTPPAAPGKQPAAPPAKQPTGQVAPAQGKSGPAQLPAMKGPGGATATNALAGTNAVAAASATDTNTFLGSLKARWNNLRNDPMAYSIGAVVVCGILALILGIRALLRRGGSKRAIAATKAPAAGKISGCNVLLAKEDSRKLWVFDSRSHGFALNREYTAAPGEKLPQHIVARSWRALFQKKLNIALLPPEHVFLKVVQLPRSTFEEMLSMVELQVEKLSPMPLAQVVWGIQVLSRTEGSLDTVVVLIVSRAVVEEFLGRLEGEGFLADRLELPLIDQLQATEAGADGAFIYPVSGIGRNMALVAWWQKGVLQNLDLASLPDADRAASLREQLMQMAWAGEIEGWMAGPPRWTLVAAQEQVADWEPALREGLEQAIEVIEPLPSAKLAARTAERAAAAPLVASLMPVEFVARYRQQFVDRLWMRGLAAVVALYILGVLVYFVALSVATYKTRAVENKVASLGLTYTNALALKAQSKVLQDRMDLKFAALDCYSTVAKLLPEGVILDSMNFTDGRRLTLMGNAPVDQTTALLDFEASLRKAAVGNQPLFGKIENISYNLNPGGGTLVWNLVAELKRTEVR